MKLSVIILNYNVRYFLELCLKSVEAAISNIEAEIIVVDNHSSDGSCEMVKSLFPGVILIENKANLGFSKGNNQGLALAKGEYVCVLNPDTMIAEDTFETLLKFAQSTENLGIVGCRLVDGGGTFLPESKRNLPSPRVALKKLIGNSKDYYAYLIDEFEIAKVTILVGAFMLMKSKVINQVGGFDEDYFMYGEDIDLSYGILKQGYDNYYYGRTTAIHFKGESTVNDKKHAKQFYMAMQVFYRKHFKRNLLFDAMVGLGIQLAYAIRPRHKVKSTQTERYVMVSDKIPESLERKLSKSVRLDLDVKQLEPHTEVILDANLLSHKQIIAYLTDKKINGAAKFKVLPKNSNFIIGSNSSKTKGEVLLF